MKIPISILAFAFMGGIMLNDFQPSSTSAVSMIGGVLKARHSVKEDAKYPRKDCPVCEGKGWYISGDGIEKVDCGYCEPVKEEIPEKTEEQVDDPPLVPVRPNTFYLRK